MVDFLKQIFLLIFSAALLVSCGGEDLPIMPDEPEMISFSPQVDNASTRAVATTTSSLSKFGVYAYVNAATPYLLMDNEPIYRNQSNKWVYDNTKYWPLNESVSFYAYTPFGESNIDYSIANKDIACIIPDNPDDQYDLMTAEALNKTETDGLVGLLFKHLLSRIDFAVTTAPDVENVTITLNTFQIVINENAILNKGVYDMTTDNWNIDNTSFMSGGSYDLINENTNLPDQGWNYNMMLLPQLHSEGNMTVNIAYSITHDDNLIMTKEASIPLSQILCEEGKKYTYNFKITLTDVTLALTVLPWNTEEKEIEL